MGSSGLYLWNTEADLERAVSKLRKQEWVGRIFTADSGDGEMGIISDTFSRKLINIDHAGRSPDVVFFRRSDDSANGEGIQGTVCGLNGAATHGSLSPYDRNAVLVRVDPEQAEQCGSNIDDTRNASQYQSLPERGTVSDQEGSILEEALQDGGVPAETEGPTVTVAQSGTARFRIVNDRSYLVGFDC